MTEETAEELRPDLLAKALHEVRDGLRLSAAQTLEQMTDDELGTAAHYVKCLSVLVNHERAARLPGETGADVSDPRSIVPSIGDHVCPGCGSEYRRGANGCSCVHVAGCKGKAATDDVASGGPLAG